MDKTKNPNIRLRRYSELILLPTFEERFEYLKLSGVVGSDTFGFDRYINQRFYHSSLWRSIKDRVIVRDLACDLAFKGREIESGIVIHHMNPIEVKDVVDRSELLIDPEYLICCSDRTHKAIHYGNETNIARDPIVRSKFDTCPWKKK